MSNAIDFDMLIERAPMVYVGDLIDEITCQKILDEFIDETEWITAQVTTYVKDEYGHESMQSITDFDRRLARRIHFNNLDITLKPNTQRALSLIKSEVSAFASKKLGFYTEDFGDEEIVRYPTGGVFTPHTDANKLKPYRALTVVLYINDNYEGGKTDFPNLGFACTPKSGRVVMFDSKLLHAGSPVLAGEKFIIVLWAFYPGGK